MKILKLIILQFWLILSHCNVWTLFTMWWDPLLQSKNLWNEHSSMYEHYVLESEPPLRPYFNFFLFIKMVILLLNKAQG